uniref:Tudor domain-containing protein n=1 Tax=Onchocerca flexuosa TaxID=387005 RepID=A0A183I2Y5_9BILA
LLTSPAATDSCSQQHQQKPEHAQNQSNKRLIFWLLVSCPHQAPYGIEKVISCTNTGETRKGASGIWVWESLLPFVFSVQPMNTAEELGSYKLQLQQVEAALLTEPDNDELLKLKVDLQEIITLQEELTSSTTEQPSSTTSDDTTKNPWKVGDQCMAPFSNGQKYLAVIDGFAQDNVAVTIVGKGTKAMVNVNNLSAVSKDDSKMYVWEKSAKSMRHRKSEWQMERERRRLRALKKEHRKKELEEAKEDEKRKWLSFNAKATSRSMKGFKRPTASGSAPDGPAWGITSQTRISSRQDLGAFKSTQRGNMDSLF